MGVGLLEAQEQRAGRGGAGTDEGIIELTPTSSGPAMDADDDGELMPTSSGPEMDADDDDDAGGGGACVHVPKDIYMLWDEGFEHAPD